MKSGRFKPILSRHSPRAAGVFLLSSLSSSITSPPFVNPSVSVSSPPVALRQSPLPRPNHLRKSYISPPLPARKSKDQMDDERKKFGRGNKPASAAGGQRRSGPGFGKAPAKAGFAKGPRTDGGKPFAKSSPKRDGERKFARTERPMRSDAPMGNGGEGKPFVKRGSGDRPPRREGGDKKFAGAERPRRGDAPTGESGERKPFVKRELGDRRAGDGAAPGRPQYWGKRPGKAEREEQAQTGDKLTPRGRRTEAVRETRFRRPAPAARLWPARKAAALWRRAKTAAF